MNCAQTRQIQKGEHAQSMLSTIWDRRTVGPCVMMVAFDKTITELSFLHKLQLKSIRKEENKMEIDCKSQTTTVLF